MLPCDLDPIRPPMAYKLSIGETRTKDGKTYPAKQDYFTVRRLSTQQGQAATYLVDADMQARLCKAVGVAEKPHEVPVSVIGNPQIVDGRPELPPSILWSRMAYYWGGKCVCACDRFGDTGTGTYARKRWEQATEGEKKVSRVAEETTGTCDPRNCPFATGNHTVTRYFGTPLCKPQIMASFVLPFAPTIGTVAVLKSTGWQTYRSLRASLLTIAERTGGWLHRVPLKLVYGYGRASDGKLVPSLRVEFNGSEDDLLGAAEQVKGRYLGQVAQLKRLEAGVVAEIVDQTQDHQHEAAFQAEFAPEGAGEDAAEAEFTSEPPESTDNGFYPTPEESERIREAEAAEYQGAHRLFEDGDEA